MVRRSTEAFHESCNSAAPIHHTFISQYDLLYAEIYYCKKLKGTTAFAFRAFRSVILSLA